MKIENLKNKVLRKISSDSDNYDHHFRVWRGIFKEFPDNDKEIHDLITSRLFHYGMPSVFNDEWYLNPVVDTIMSSDYVVDILFYNDKKRPIKGR